jgi:hypothetical protein
MGGLMSLQAEFQYALQDGRGKSEAASYKLVIWSGREEAAVAYSREKKEALLLLLAGSDFRGLGGDEYLDTAKSLNRAFGWFCAPAQRLGPQTYWAGKTRGPVYAYRFNILNEPVNGEMA